MTEQKLDTAKPEGTPAGGTFGEPLWRALLRPFLLFVALLLITLYAALYQRFEERDEALHAGEIARTLVCCRAERLTEDTLRPLRGVQLEVIDHGPPDQQAFAAAIAPIVQLEPSYRTLALVDAENHVTACWIRAGIKLDASSAPVIGQDLAGTSTAWGHALERARGSGEAIAAEPVQQDQPDLLDFVIPIRRESDNMYQGAIVGTLSIADLLQDLFDPRVARQFNVTLRDAQDRIRGGQGSPPARWTAGVGASEPVKVLDSTWNLRVVPAVSYDRGLPVNEPVWIFIVGLIISVLASGAMLQMVLYRRRERLRTQEHLGALEALNLVSAAVTAAPEGAETRLLARIGEEAKRLLRMPLGGVLLLEHGEPQTVRIVPATSEIKPLKERLMFAEASGVRHCLQSGQVLIVPDVHRDRGPLSPEQVEAYGVRSVVMVPLVVNGRPLGVIGLCDYVPRRFSDLEIRMAQLYGAQAAVVLAQSRLYDQLRSQADTNQALLRELNHRVKNNLAGIHGLLVMDQPKLSAEAHHWLDRVAARVQVMARAHELFSSGIDSIGLEDLVNKTLASIRAIKPSGVQVEVDFRQVGKAALATDRAVTLAIVLNELCYNSIVHGLGTDGTLTVRGRAAATPGMTAIDIIDTGRNGNGETDPGGDHGVWPAISSSGIGLSLVSQLVGRELQGKLSIAPSPQGGTVATVEFPTARMQPPAGESE